MNCEAWMPLHYVLAIAVLTAPLDDEVPEHLLVPITTLQAVALEWELVDPRELRYFAASEAVLKSGEVIVLRIRYQRLRNAPPLADVMRFPPRRMTSGMLASNKEYRDHIQGQIRLEPWRWAEFQDTLGETEYLRHVWELLDNVACVQDQVPDRRHALRRLRDALGDQDYYRGRLPPHVPLWRFRTIP